MKTCKKCGESNQDEFYAGLNALECKSCFKKRRAIANVSNKLKIIEYMGGCCKLCGYDRYYGSLHIHHLDRATKSKRLSQSNIRSWKWERILEELDKCVLLCANCHAEVEGNITRL